jgi:hypothetical protein
MNPGLVCHRKRNEIDPLPGLRPGLVNCLLGVVILWGIFNGFQRDMAVGFLDELRSRNLVNLFASPLSVPEYLTGLVPVNAIKVIIGVALEAVTAWLFYHSDIFPILPRFVPFILNLALFVLAIGIVVTGLIFRYTTRFQTLELCGHSDAAVVRPLSTGRASEVSQTNRVAVADDSLFRGYAPRYHSGRTFADPFLMGPAPECLVLRLRDVFLQLDVQISKSPWFAGEDGVVWPRRDSEFYPVTRARMTRRTKLQQTGDPQGKVL